LLGANNTQLRLMLSTHETISPQGPDPDARDGVFNKLLNSTLISCVIDNPISLIALILIRPEVAPLRARG
jgi:hypothetical protein